jgi:hypothetical protein
MSCSFLLPEQPIDLEADFGGERAEVARGQPR